MAVAIATYGFEIPRDGSLVVTLNEQVAAHVGEEGQGSKLGRHLQQVNVASVLFHLSRIALFRSARVRPRPAVSSWPFPFVSSRG
eukprot:1307460-Rhodomonas_salina.1